MCSRVVLGPCKSGRSRWFQCVCARVCVYIYASRVYRAWSAENHPSFSNYFNYKEASLFGVHAPCPVSLERHQVRAESTIRSWIRRKWRPESEPVPIAPFFNRGFVRGKKDRFLLILANGRIRARSPASGYRESRESKSIEGGERTRKIYHVQ